MKSKIEIEVLKERFAALDSEEIEIALQSFPHQFITAEIDRRFRLNDLKRKKEKEIEELGN